MKGIKKIVSILLIGVVGVGLAACNGGGRREQSGQQALEMLYRRFDGEIESGTSEDPIILHILENDTAKQSGYLAELLSGFNSEYAEYNIIAVDANQDQYSNLADDGPYGYGPDVLYQANDVLMKYCAGKHIIPLPIEKVEAYSALPELVKDTYTYTLGDTDYFMGVGVNVQAPMLYYRKDLLPSDWQTTWDDNKNGIPDMVEDMRKMYKFGKQRNAANKEQYGYMHSLNDPYFASGYLFTYGAYVFGSDNTDCNDVGFNAGNAYKGAGIILQLAGTMNSGCIDDSITRAREAEFAKGTYFAVSNTQDMYGTMQGELSKIYQKDGMPDSAAKAAAIENIGVAPLPSMPASGLLEDGDASELLPSVVMGGINGYAISSYTKYPKASLAFLNYATSYEKMLRRNALLGVAPARADSNRDCTYQGNVAHELFGLVEQNRISIMPSIPEVDFIWTPIATACVDLATDPYRVPEERKFLKDDGTVNFVKLQSVCDKIVESVKSEISIGGNL